MAAAASELAAGTSETSAGNSASSANTSASTATTKANEASTSAFNAGESETNAAGSASVASTKASEASVSASTASTKASEASTSASSALASKNAASTSESNSGTSETNAATSASKIYHLILSSMQTQLTVLSIVISVLDFIPITYCFVHLRLHRIYPYITGFCAVIISGGSSFLGLGYYIGSGLLFLCGLITIITKIIKQCTKIIWFNTKYNQIVDNMNNYHILQRMTEIKDIWSTTEAKAKTDKEIKLFFNIK